MTLLSRLRLRANKKRIKAVRDDAYAAFGTKAADVTEQHTRLVYAMPSPPPP
jgi:hypothetical protein